MRVPAPEPTTRTQRIRLFAPGGGATLTALDEAPLKQPRVDIGEYRLKALAVDLGEYPLRQLRMDLPQESAPQRPVKSLLGWTRYLFVLVGLMGAGIYGWFYAEARVYQAYENWRLNQIARHCPADLRNFLTSYLGGNAFEVSKEPPAAVEGPTELQSSRPESPLAAGMLIGRLEIPRLSLSAVVLQGDSDEVLRKGVGHIPSTSLPGGSGNVAIAGHRDTFFRPLKDIRREDTITLTTTTGTYHYRVDSMQVVKPDDTQVLAPSDQASLTLVTCYPFYFVGSAPKRYIVHAQQLEPSRVVPQLSPVTVPPRPEAGPSRPSPDDRPGLGTAHADDGESVGMDGKVLCQPNMTLRAIYPPIRRRMQVWQSAALARLQKERDWVNARVAAALESFMNTDD